MKKNLLWVILALVVVIGGVYWYKQKENKKSKENVVKVGAILPLTGGGSADAGEQLKNSFEMFKDEYNIENDLKLQIEYGDSKNSAADGISVYQKMNKLDNINFFIASNSGVVVPLSKEVAKNQNALLMTTINSSAGVPESGDNIFRVFVSIQNEAKTMSNYIKTKLNKNRVAVLYINDDFGLSGVNTFENIFGNVSYKSPFEKGSSDFKNVVLKVPKDVEVVYVIGYDNALGTIIKQLREFGYKNTIVSTIGMSIEPWRKNAGDAAEGVIYTSSNFNPSSANREVREFTEKFMAKFNKTPTALNVFGYYSMKILINGIKNCPDYSPKCVISKINNSTHESIMGKISIDNVGEADLPLSIYIFKNGKDELLEE